MKKSNFEEVSIFQQDSAPAHRAEETVALLSREIPDFIPPWLWSPSSPDLNPVDYQVWSVLEQRVYRTCIRDISHLVWLKSGRRLSRRSLTGRSASGVYVGGHAFNKKEDTLSIGCETV